MPGEEFQPVSRPGQTDVAKHDVGGLGRDETLGRDYILCRAHDIQIRFDAKQGR